MFRNLSLLSLLFLTFPLSVGFVSPKVGEKDEDWRWVWAVVAAVVVIWVISWWLNRGQRSESSEAPASPEPAARSVSVPESSAEPDDLKVIEGIGPKIAGLLQEAGIRTFNDLASADVGRLQEILENAGPRYRLADPGTWPKQAALAAEGKWDELKELQESLKGGRVV